MGIPEPPIEPLEPEAAFPLRERVGNSSDSQPDTRTDNESEQGTTERAHSPSCKSEASAADQDNLADT